MFGKAPLKAQNDYTVCSNYLGGMTPLTPLGYTMTPLTPLGYTMTPLTPLGYTYATEARNHQGAFGVSSLQTLLCPSKFVVPRKICFKRII